MKYLVSVAMPTHNRSKYAISAIRSILAIASDELQLVVSDTSTDGLLLSLVSADESLTGDNRLKYMNPTQTLDMTGNHNNVISHCDGEYICLIGDDDSVVDSILRVAAWAKESGIPLVTQKIRSNYVWPDFRHRWFKFGHASRLYIDDFSGTLKRYCSAQQLGRSLERGCQGTEGLPKVYHGLVHRDLLAKVKDIADDYFFGSSPDVSGAISLCCVTDSYIELDFPFTIPGAGGGSNTGRSAMNRHKGDMKAETQVRGVGWDFRVPRFFSVETVWADASIETLKKHNPSLVVKFNFERLYAECFVKHLGYRAEIFEAIKVHKTEGGAVKLITPLVIQYMASRCRYYVRRVLRPTASGGRKYIDGVEDLEAARVKLQGYLKANYSGGLNLPSGSVAVSKLR